MRDTDNPADGPDGTCTWIAWRIGRWRRRRTSDSLIRKDVHIAGGRASPRARSFAGWKDGKPKVNSRGHGDQYGASYLPSPSSPHCGASCSWRARLGVSGLARRCVRTRPALSGNHPVHHTGTRTDECRGSHQDRCVQPARGTRQADSLVCREARRRRRRRQHQV